MSRKQDLERLELQMAKFSPMQERRKRILAELKTERQAKLYAALHGYVSDAQLDNCTKEEIAGIVKAHLNGESHELDSVTEAEKVRRAEFEARLHEAAGRAAGRKKTGPAVTKTDDKSGENEAAGAELDGLEDMGEAEG